MAYRVRRADRLVTRLYDQSLQPTGLTSPQLTLLSAVANRPGLSSAELGALLGLEASSLSRALALLQRRRLVRALPSQRDRRERLWELTEAGVKKAREAFALWQTAQEGLRRALGAGGVAALTAALQGLHE
jgi:DNA-binding MarR family transcriptional regulator